MPMVGPLRPTYLASHRRSGFTKHACKEILGKTFPCIRYSQTFPASMETTRTFRPCAEDFVVAEAALTSEPYDQMTSKPLAPHHIGALCDGHAVGDHVRRQVFRFWRVRHSTTYRQPARYAHAWATSLISVGEPSSPGIERTSPVAGWAGGSTAFADEDRVVREHEHLVQLLDCRQAQRRFI